MLGGFFVDAIVVINSGLLFFFPLILEESGEKPKGGQKLPISETIIIF